MFHRNRNNQQTTTTTTTETHPRGFFGRFRRPPHPMGPTGPADVYPGHPAHMTVAPQYGPQGVNRAYYRDPYYEGSTRSDWDHYAVRHEEALIGDPVPIIRDNLNLSAQQAWAGPNSGVGPYGPGPLSEGPVNHGYDDMHYNKRHPAYHALDKNGNPLVGPVVANGPLPGNLSTGTVVERNLVRGPGRRRTRTGFVDDAPYGGREWMSTAWGPDDAFAGGAAPLWQGKGKHGGSLYGPGLNQGHWGSAPLWGFRDGREYGHATPLLPDNPWTHNELGRDWADGYRRGTLPYSSINNSYTQAPITETFVNYGSNGERIEGYRTRSIREDILPPLQGLGQTTETNTTKTVKDTVIPGHQPTVGGFNPSMPIPADAISIPLTEKVISDTVVITPTETLEIIETAPVAKVGSNTATVVRAL